MTFETAEPAEVGLILTRGGIGSGGGLRTHHVPGEKVARGRLVVYLAYLPASKADDFVQKSCLMFALEELDDDGRPRSGSADPRPVSAPDAKNLSEILKMPFKAGDYPYTGMGAPDEKAVEILSVGENRLYLRVWKPVPK